MPPILAQAVQKGQSAQTEAAPAKTTEEQLTPEQARQRAAAIVELALVPFGYHANAQQHDKNAIALMQRTLKDLQTHLDGRETDKERIAALEALWRLESSRGHRSPDAIGKVTPKDGTWNFHEIVATKENGYQERYVLNPKKELLLTGGPKNAHYALSDLCYELRNAMRLDRAKADQGLATAIELLDKVNPPTSLPAPGAK